MKITVLDKALMGEDLPFEILEKFGTLTVFDNTRAEETTKNVADSDVIILNKVKITREVIYSAKNLKLICVFATGYDNIDITAARERGVAVANVPGYSTESVLLFTMATALALYSKLYEFNKFVKSGEYTSSGYANKLTPVYHELSGKCWGIIGCGNIGSSVARVATALGAKVIVNKRTPTSEFECVDIDTICRESDIISIHCPLNDSTKNLINKEKIALMKDSVVLVNEARGAVINEKDVADAIVQKKIAAFGSDVYSAEPFGEDHPFYKIKTFDNVILTPHAAWAAYEARERCLNIISDNIDAFISGDRKNRVD